MTDFKTPVSQRVRSRGGEGEQWPPTTPRLVIPPSPCMKQLGYGTGVNVYLMERFSPHHGCYKSPWAVKKINRKIKDVDQEYSKRLIFEAEVLKSLQHPNIIGFRSYTSHSDGTPCLVMESGQRSLADLIEAREEQDLGPFPSKAILKVAKDIALALQYLHHEKRLLHGDMKSANILIKGDFEIAKLCDFGVTLKLDEQGVALPDQYYVGTECWSASEALIGDTLSHKTDMFSFGLVLWEMISLGPPHLSMLSSEDSLDCDTTANLCLQEEEYNKALGTRPMLPNVVLDDDYLPVLELFYACTEIGPVKRPSATQVLQVLDYTHTKEKTIDAKKEVVSKGR